MIVAILQTLFPTFAQGTPIDDFDLLIGAAAIQQDLILVTDNVKHFKNIRGLVIENWVER